MPTPNAIATAILSTCSARPLPPSIASGCWALLRAYRRYAHGAAYDGAQCRSTSPTFDIHSHRDDADARPKKPLSSNCPTRRKNKGIHHRDHRLRPQWCQLSDGHLDVNQDNLADQVITAPESTPIALFSLSNSTCGGCSDCASPDSVHPCPTTRLWAWPPKFSTPLSSIASETNNIKLSPLTSHLGTSLLRACIPRPRKVPYISLRPFSNTARMSNEITHETIKGSFATPRSPTVPLHHDQLDPVALYHDTASILGSSHVQHTIRLWSHSPDKSLIISAMQEVDVLPISRWGENGWYKEESEMWPGQAQTLRVEKVLHHEKSKYQDVLVFKSTDYGVVLVLDNVVQCTERDEFAYQEMITHLAMNSHPNPKKVLVIGGGDGGVLREIVKHDCVEEAILCDIDEAVIRVSKQYLPNMSSGFDHPKVKVHIGDGFKFLADYKNEFDVIITDSSDPEGPAEALFQKPYFQLLHDALREGGVISTQGSENQWLHLPLITKLKADCKTIFPVAEYAYTTIPTYPSGQIGFMICCKDGSRNVRVPLRSWSEEEEDDKCRYYNSDIHKASFILPNFAKKALQ
ncbi:hypothetical protein G7046_g9065 [Stylonectria norvegica]|nr:hypothetical protein G7046_g9065 [Stylonectria norvegica]